MVTPGLFFGALGLGAGLFAAVVCFYLDSQVGKLRDRIETIERRGAAYCPVCECAPCRLSEGQVPEWPKGAAC